MAKILAVCSVALAALLGPASAQDSYPSRTIRLIVGFTPGGGVDTVARLFADKMTGILGQPIVVVNQGGAAGGIAGKRVSTE
ncbi:MAG TPA: tripartite tricarboxylate transporter substrate binding protein, partial [Pseudolabrys sp.]|nr:tripartite tricarboxylate transporter substrate binding protein [Pseudolabrys sp.]